MFFWGVKTVKFHLGKVKRDKKKGTAKLKVKVWSAGTVVLRGSRKVRHAKKTIDGKGSLWMPIKSKGHARKRLKKRGSVRVVARFIFKPTEGENRTKARSIKLVKKRHGKKHGKKHGDKSGRTGRRGGNR